MAKTVAAHAAVLIGWLRFDGISWVQALLPLGFATVTVVAFFAWLLVDLLRRATPGTPGRRQAAGSAAGPLPAPAAERLRIVAVDLRPVGHVRLFLPVYVLLLAANAAILALALPVWYRQAAALPRPKAEVHDTRGRVGYIPGVYDLFHVGHLNILRAARADCDYLVAGVVSDERPRPSRAVAPSSRWTSGWRSSTRSGWSTRSWSTTPPTRRRCSTRSASTSIFKGDDWRNTPKGDQLEASMAAQGCRGPLLPVHRRRLPARCCVSGSPSEREPIAGGLADRHDRHSRRPRSLRRVRDGGRGDRPPAGGAGASRPRLLPQRHGRADEPRYYKGCGSVTPARPAPQDRRNAEPHRHCSVAHASQSRRAGRGVRVQRRERTVPAGPARRRDPGRHPRRRPGVAAGEVGAEGKRYYRWAERLAVRWSDALIADAPGIADYYREDVRRRHRADRLRCADPRRSSAPTCSPPWLAPARLPPRRGPVRAREPRAGDRRGLRRTPPRRRRWSSWAPHRSRTSTPRGSRRRRR